MAEISGLKRSICPSIAFRVAIYAPSTVNSIMQQLLHIINVVVDAVRREIEKSLGQLIECTMCHGMQRLLGSPKKGTAKL